MFGLFQEWGQTKSGGPKLKIGGRWVFPDRACNLDGLQPGMNVEYETRMGGRDGKLTILARIRPAPAGSPVPPSLPTGVGQIGSTITDGDILRSVSNVVGNLAAAGKIDDERLIAVFVNAAYSAFTNMGKAQASAGVAGSAPKDDFGEYMSDQSRDDDGLPF